MAAHGRVAYLSADGNDYVEHERTYRLFVQLTKWGATFVGVVLILMAVFLL